MKRFISVFLAISFSVVLFSLFAGCAYQVDENHCIVGLYEKYQLYSKVDGKLCEPINKKIKGVDKDFYTNYYSVLKGAEYTIVCDSLIDYEGNYLGSSINSDYFINAYWQGDIIRSGELIFSEESGLQDEEFFVPNYKQLNTDINVTFSVNCNVSLYMEPFLYVGAIFEVASSSDGRNNEIANCINEDGSVNEKDGLYYMLLQEEICIHQDAWKTNFEVVDYNYEYTDARYGEMQAQFTVTSPVLSDNEELHSYIVCRTRSGKYFVHPTNQVDMQDVCIPIRQHQLKINFTPNS